VDKFEIDLAPERVDADDFDADGIAEAEFAAVAAAFGHVFLLVIVVVVVREESEMDRIMAKYIRVEYEYKIVSRSKEKPRVGPPA
jgi:hypothetical protein